MSNNSVINYYNNNSEKEWNRLTSTLGFVEFTVTLNLIKKYFPLETKNVLDFGSGPGKYALELLKMGYETTLSDISIECLKLAECIINEHGFQAKEYIACDALDFVVSDKKFDGILLLGPMYHICDKSGRIKILEKCKSMLSNNGVIIVSYLNFYGILRALVNDSPKRFDDMEFMDKISDDYNFFQKEGGFADMHWSSFQKSSREIESTGLKIITSAGAESFLSGMGKVLNEIKNESAETYYNIVKKAVTQSEENAFKNASEHLLFVLNK